MANYSVNITDNGDTTFSLTTVIRAPGTIASGGTTISSASVHTYDTAHSLTGKRVSPMEVLQHAIEVIQADRSAGN